MAGNTTPIFAKNGKQSWTGNLTSGTNNYDGTSGTTLLFTADATNGSFVNKVTCKAAGTNVATVVRIFINNGSTTSTAANNALCWEQSLPATTASASSATINFEIPLNIVLAAGYKLYVVMATSVAAGWQFSAIGGDY